MIDSNFLKTAPSLVKAEYSVPFAKIDSSFRTKCGYLIVPENRSKTTSKMVKLPFIVLESKNPFKKKDPLLFTSGGPGNSSLSWIFNAARGDLIKDRDLIAFEQRGTRYAWPYLRVFDLDNAIRESYRKNLNKDSMVLVGVKKYRRTLEMKGIDLAGYTTDETVLDIHDLLKMLKIDSVNLYGGSYSGGLMTAVLQKDPSRIRSLVLDSPLPMFAAIDEDEPMNFNQSLTTLFKYVEQDSTDKQSYRNLKERFFEYFNGIARKTFYLRYLEKGTTDSVNIAYTKNELLAEIMNAMSDNQRRNDVAFIITDMINGNHKPYVKSYLDALFRKYQAPDGMRISVYCADQATYHSQDVIKQLYNIYPYLTRYRINDVIKDMCDCWPTPPVTPSTKQPYYSLKPVLMADGEMDPNCSPLYIQRLQHYMPHAQSFLFLKKGHGVGGSTWNVMMREFLNNPYKKVQVSNPDVVVY
ncbi:alpha/beta fold hydrolase [Mucilaginibacter sp. HME9299]|uniref:Alpha/beta fold hydrolase n=2 Tax=Mucilaginibacter aquatilis TaxID=1517760 RepID=A0A6I4I8J4_9SPHI|nr:alpha/beta fold hydrolase [Mucilaginibacter aquatilis]